MTTPATPATPAATPEKPSMATLVAMAGVHGDTYESVLGNTPMPIEQQKPPVTEQKEIDTTKPIVDATAETTETETTETETAETKPVVEEDEVDRYLKSLEAPAATKVEWTPEELAKFKTATGMDSVDQMITEYNTTKEQLTLAAEKSAAAEAIQKRIATMPYELAKALEAVADGKPYKELLQDLSMGLTLSKDAKDIPPEALLDKYGYGKKFTREVRESIADGTADEGTKGLWDEYVELASSKHNEARAKERTAITERAAAQKAYAEASEKADLAAVAYLKTDKATAALASKADIDKFLSGELENELLYNADGTRKPNSLALLLRAKNHDRIVERIRKGAHVAGKNEATVAAHNKLPGTPAQAAGQRGNPPPKGNPAPQTNASSQLADLMGLPTLT